MLVTIGALGEGLTVRTSTVSGPCNVTPALGLLVAEIRTV
jgi:hypothetical protein